MTVIGVTGHSTLTVPSLALVHRKVLELLRPRATGLVGMTCLARGADQVFADVVLALGGALHVVAPARDYFSAITDPGSRQRCERFLRQAVSTVVLGFDSAGPEAYRAANEYLVDRCDLLVAVWDGSPETGAGGTADAVAHARRRGRTILRAWPDGAERS